MKLVATITDVTSVVCAGGSPVRESVIIEIQDDKIPKLIKKHFGYLKETKENKHHNYFASLSFSILLED
jgi:hypothetical protein